MPYTSGTIRVSTVLRNLLVSASFLIGLSACGGGSSEGGDINPQPQNQPPSASAGTDQSVNENSEVTLMGSGTDPDGTIASYSWTQTSGESVTLQNADSSSAIFQAPEVITDEQLIFELTVTDDDGASATDIVTITVNSVQLITEIRHFILNGQSLGAGEESSPPVTNDASNFGSVMFARSERTWQHADNAATPDQRADSEFSLIPLQTTKNGYLGETIANGLSDHAAHNQEKQYGKAIYLFSYCGQGGRYLRELNKRHDDATDSRAGSKQSPGGYYNTCIDDVARGREQAFIAGIDYKVAAVFWMQGEADGSFKRNRWDSAEEPDIFYRTYADDLKDLADDYIADIQAITGQISVPFITYQTRGFSSGMAQLMAADEHPHIYMGTPIYQVPSASISSYDAGGTPRWGDNIHLSADGQRWTGEQFAKIQARIHAGEDWQPLRPIQATAISDTKIALRFHVPRPPLVIDEQWLPMETSIGLSLAGIRLDGSSGHRPGVTEVKVSNGDTIEVTLTNPMRAGQTYSVMTGNRNLNQQFRWVIDSTAVVGGNVEVTLTDDHSDEVTEMAKNGVFLGYRWGGNNYGDIFPGNFRIRESRLDNGKTVLIGEVAEANDFANFVPGDFVSPGLMHSYGNIRDSDPKESTYRFGAGPRKGQPYPLWNWAIQVRDLAVEGWN